MSGLPDPASPTSGAPDPAQPAPVRPEGVARAFARGVAWTGAMRLVSQSASWVSTLALARLLSASDYGIIGMAMPYLGLLQMLSEFGIGTAVVTRDGLTERQIAQLNTFSVMLGLLGAGVICLTAPLVGAFYRNEALVPVLAVLSISFVVNSFRSVPWALLQRDMRFKRLAIYDAVQAVVLAGASVALAFAGFRYWTLVAAAVLSALLTTGMTLAAVRVPLARPDPRAIRPLLSFGANVVVERIAWYLSAQSDFFVAGRMLGASLLGVYSLAATLANTVIEKVSAMVLQVTPSALSRVRDHPDTLRTYVVRITEMLLLVLLPASIGLMLVAEDFVLVVLGARWRPLVTPLQALCAYASLRVAMPLFFQVLLVCGRVRYAAVANIALLVVMPPTFVVASRWGPTGIALGWVVVYPLVAIPVVVVMLRTIQLSARRLFTQAVWPPASSCAVMALAVLGAQAALPENVGSPTRLLVAVPAGGLAYAAMLATFHRARFTSLLAAMRELRAGRE
jgi:PST family polysaccharide transporter